MVQFNPKSLIVFVTKFTSFFLLIFISIGILSAQDVFKPEDVFRTKSCTGARISPDGKWIAYTVAVQRDVHENAGRAYGELYLVSTTTGEIKPFICGKKTK